MSWQYTLRPETRMPACPYCKSRSGVVRLQRGTYVCLDHFPREAWEARWVEDAGEPRGEQAS